ncbi:MAG: tRNA (adenosine(37)-N6)-threonylcarbamoyltransferase complex dimerization subunit type 1 TsaB [Zoogloeaceae bacterium]|nr:tRNA (adenosine(37)-N6)-threonylcarbamoyltransferase complex dimerization subunit type 1 TsaB [Zoogloeaceae bacterium]
MKILAIETSCEQGSVALYWQGDLVERVLVGHARHSEFILPTISELLAEAGAQLGDLDALAFGAGPGAFTGVRLACGVVQGLALGSGVPIVPVGSLEALALGGTPGRVLAATDARMGEVYLAALGHSGDRIDVIEEARCLPPELIALPDGGPWRGAGSGFAAYQDRIPAAILAALTEIDATAVPRAAHVARLALPRVMAGEGVGPEAAVPLYIRDKVALTTNERLARGARG